MYVVWEMKGSSCTLPGTYPVPAHGERPQGPAYRLMMVAVDGLPGALCPPVAPAVVSHAAGSARAHVCTPAPVPVRGRPCVSCALHQRRPRTSRAPHQVQEPLQAVRVPCGGHENSTWRWRWAVGREPERCAHGVGLCVCVCVCAVELMAKSTSCQPCRACIRGPVQGRLSVASLAL